MRKIAESTVRRLSLYLRFLDEFGKRADPLTFIADKSTIHTIDDRGFVRIAL